MASTSAAQQQQQQQQRAEDPSYPSAWETASGRGVPASMRYLEVSGLRVKYKGPGSDDRDAAAIRTDHPVPASCPFYYFEIDIVNKGRDGFIGIGFSVQDVKLDRLPGWEPNSYGYHGDDGHVFNGRGSGRPYGPVFGTGDWIGVAFNRVERTISFTKKGYDLGVAFENVPPTQALYPTVGFRTPEEEICANFGADLVARPFRGDVAGLRRDVTDRLYAHILATAVPRPRKSQDVVGELVFGYLAHHGHWATAEAVGKDVLGGSAAVPTAARKEAAALQVIASTVDSGAVDAAVDAAERLAPGVMAAHPRVGFALQTLKFCELIRAGKDEEAVAFGRELALMAGHPTDQWLLEEALTLFAYVDPTASPAGYLLSPEHRSELAAGVQRAVRMQLGRREVSALEDVYRQARAVHAELVALGDPAAALVNLDEFMERLQDDQ